MKKFKICYANWNMRKELEHLWQVCFDDFERPVKYFFDNYFNTRNCIVGLINGRAAAAVHLLPAQLALSEGLVKAHYIYAAATMPEYRGNGYMGALLNAAAAVGRSRGDQYSFLLPADKQLYRFYEKFNYKRYFKIRILTLSYDELRNISEVSSKIHIQLTNKQITDLRNLQLIKQYGSVIWGTEAVAYAVESNRLYSGRLISAEKDGNYCYALCRVEEKDICEIKEITADLSTLSELAANILYYMPAKYYRFRLPYNNLFINKGIPSDFGMIKALNDASAYKLGEDTAAYLGLTLD